MASIPLQFFLLLWTTTLIFTPISSSNQHPKHHIVYMGTSPISSNVNNQGDPTFSESSHLQLLSSVIPSEEKERITLTHHYHHAFRGFSAMLTQNEASILSEKPEVVSIFEDPTVELHTTRSWDFLETDFDIKWRNKHHFQPPISSDVIIGFIDTGIWPESPSFNDEGIGKIPSRWKGVCMEGHDFNKSNCNRKLIGARYYNSTPTKSSNGKNTTTISANLNNSPRDTIYHGTHMSSIAAGALVPNASYYGLAYGTARGGAPSARIAMYKVCSEDGCPGSTILQAIHDSIKDGVDMISLSLGMSSLFANDYLQDPISIGAFHAQQNGVMVIGSGGNEGPDPYTVVNVAPWIVTVVASNIDRELRSDVVLGNGKTLRGSAINFSNLNRSAIYPLVFGKDAAAPFTPAKEARTCYPGSLDTKKVKGKIVVCVGSDPSLPRKIVKLIVEDAKAEGLIFVNDDFLGIPFDSGVFPFVEVGNSVGYKILKYINSTKNPTATILRTYDVPRSKPAPVVAHFSSRGPGLLTENILKPDIMAPGVAILAAVIPEVEEGSVPIGKNPPSYALKSGTSMAAPHVTGAAAFVKSVHHGWSPSMIRSALMTTATIYDNNGKPTTNNSINSATPHDMGTGEVNPIRALDPGLVFETTSQDYLQFLCHYGYTEKSIKSISNSKNFICPNKSMDAQISNMNYPSISISRLNRTTPIRRITRTATNVGKPNSTYIAEVQAPSGFDVRISPRKLTFIEGVKSLSFRVLFDAKQAVSGYNFGYVNWSDGSHQVRLVFAVNVE
ncbi:hypothetical protein ACFE04_003148 [Oxalis oulophora]